MHYHWKDVLIGLLAAYVTLDLLLAYATKVRHPGVLATLQMAMSDENVGVVVAISLVVGFLAYYLSCRTKDYFSTKKERED
jgi:hypothetical protein